MVLNEIVWRIVPPELEGAGWMAARLRAEVEIRKLLLEGRSSVSDQSREAVKTEGLDPEDASAMTEGQTPHPSLHSRITSLEERLERERCSSEMWANEAAALQRHLSTLTKALKEKDAALEPFARAAAAMDPDIGDDGSVMSVWTEIEQHKPHITLTCGHFRAAHLALSREEESGR